MKKVLITLAVLIGVQGLSYAQDGWNWPEDENKRALAMEKNALYTDMLNSENYEMAKKPLLWLLKETPDLNASIYIQGVKIFENLARTGSGQSQKNLQDSTILLYDLRMKYFNDVDNVTNRKAFDAYQMWKDRSDRRKDLYDLQKSTVELLGTNILNGNTIYYMDAARRYKLSGGGLTDLDIIDIYDQINEILDAKEAAGESADKLSRYRENVDKIFNSSVTIDCNIIDQQLYPKFIEKGKPLEDAQRIVKFGLAGGCTGNDSFIEAAKVVLASSPEFGLWRLIALKSKSNGNLEEAEQYFKEALKYTEDNIKQGEVYLDLADIASKNGRKTDARSFAYKALEVDPSKSEAYIIIGDLYFKSGEDCKAGKDVVKDRAVYIAAYDMYMKGGNSARLELAKEQFPSKEDIFNYNYTVGQVIEVNCWIGGTVKVQTRD